MLIKRVTVLFAAIALAGVLARAAAAEQLCDDGTGNIGPCNGPPAHSYISLQHLVWLVIGVAIVFALGKAAGRKESSALLSSSTLDDEDEGDDELDT